MACGETDLDLLTVTQVKSEFQPCTLCEKCCAGLCPEAILIKGGGEQCNETYVIEIYALIQRLSPNVL